MKKIGFLSLIMTASLAISGYKPVTGDGNMDEVEFDNTQYVFDYSDVLSDSQEQELQSELAALKAKYNMDFVVVSTEDIGLGDRYMNADAAEKYVMAYADNFYDYGGYGDSGVLYLMSTASQYDGMWMSTAGMAYIYIDDKTQDEILDNIWEDLLDYDYYGSVKTFIDEMDDLMDNRTNDSDFIDLKEKWDEGHFTDGEDFYQVYRSKVDAACEDNFFTPFRRSFGLCILVNAVIALIAVVIMVAGRGTKMTVNSSSYIKHGSLNIFRREDRYSHRTTTSHQVSSSSGGGGGGGHSSHRSSSGRSHGGGGRHR